MERGIRAENNRLYLTAQREFEQVLKKVPTHVEARAHLLIAAFYNSDLPALVGASKSLIGKTFDDNDLYQRADNIINLSSQFFPSDSLDALLERYKGDTALVHTAIENYYRKNPADLSAAMKLASDASDNNDYAKADTILQKKITEGPESIAALTLLSSIKRYERDAPGALKCIDQLLALNKEDLYAISSKARVMLMMKKDNEALQLAKQADKLNGKFPYNMATLAMVYHYTNRIIERDDIINKARASKDSSMMEYMQYAIDIIDNKEKFRD